MEEGELRIKDLYKWKKERLKLKKEGKAENRNRS